MILHESKSHKQGLNSELSNITECINVHVLLHMIYVSQTENSSCQKHISQK